MKKIILVLVFVLMFPIVSMGITYESITVADTAIGITAGYLPSSVIGCQYWKNIDLMCTLETAQVRFRLDGTSPTTSEGHILNAGDILYVKSCMEIYYFKAIRTGSTSGVLKCTLQ